MRYRGHKKHLSVGIMGVHFAGSATAGINVIRSLLVSANIDPELIVLSNYPISCSLGMGSYIKQVYLVPFPAQGPQAMLKRFKEIVLQRPIHVLIPCDDDEVVILSKIQHQLRSLGIETLLPPAETVLAVRKDKLYETACRLSFPIAKTWIAKSIKTFRRNFDYPVVVKGVLCDAFLARNSWEARVYYRKIRDVWGLPVIFQEFIDGDEYAIVCLADGLSRVVGAVVINKMGITEKGKTWCGYTVNDPVLLSLACEVVEKLRWVGPIEIEVIRSKDTKKYKIIEINPRFPAWIYLATAAGQNLPEALVQIALGYKLCSLPTYRTGVAFTRICGYTTYPVTLLGQLTTNGRISLENQKEIEHKPLIDASRGS